METDCIFCKIIDGWLPSAKILESKEVLAFLDINPVAQGHVLVVPKEHSKNLLEVSEKPMKELLKAIQAIGKAQMDAFGAQGFNVLQSNNPAAGQVVFHTHFHVVPRKDGDGLRLGWPARQGAKDFESAQKSLKKHLKN